MSTDPVTATVAAYDTDAARYGQANPEMPDGVRADIEEFVAMLPPGARVLEIGTGSGRDAALMEQLGLRVRRTDITPGFVDLLRARGLEAELLDPLVDDLSDPAGPYDGVWANASLLHVLRDDLARVLTRLADVTRAHGVLRFSVKQGDGEGWSTHGAITRPRHFTYWQPEPLEEVVRGSGWTRVTTRSEIAGKRDERWIEVRAVRA
ncbi:MAG: class I SAM-dependent methyltransferase [Nocardioides sp.]|nr:class I SAM-dependent methyltransferase [Nocardioides sp.]